MARKIKISAGLLNVRIHPHSMNGYTGWLSCIFDNRAVANIHGDRYGIISSFDRSRINSGIVEGVITTFIKFDVDKPWFNLSKLSEATEEQISHIKIPNDLFPNSSAFTFYFDANSHKLYFQNYSGGKTFTPNSALKLFVGLSKNDMVVKKYGEAKISIVQDHAGLEKILSLKRIKTMRIYILKPNGDIFDKDFASRIEGHMAKTGSKKISISYQAEDGQSITPTNDLKDVCEVALENGSVEVTGRDEKGAVTLNSNNYPKILHDTYDPDEFLEGQAFRRLLPYMNRQIVE